MRMTLPVRGLRPLRARRLLTMKVPKPPMVTRRPFLSDSKTSSRKALSARSAETLDSPEALAIAATRSAFVMVFLPTRATGPKSRGDALHRLQERLGGEGLLDDGRAGGLEEPPRFGFGRIAGDEHEAADQVLLMGGRHAVELFAAAVRHPDIGDDQVVPAVAQPLESGATAGGDIDLPAPLAQERGHQIDDAGLVVHDEGMAPAPDRRRRGGWLSRRTLSGRCHCRQLHGEHGPSRPGRDAELASVLLDDAVGHAEPQARSHPDPLGGEERLEDPGQHVSRNTRAIVRHLGDEPGPIALPTRRDAHTNAVTDALLTGPAAEDGLLGIEHQIEEDLLELVHVAIDLRQGIAIVGLDVNARERELGRAKPDGLFQHLTQVHRPPLRLSLAREEQQALDDLRHPVALHDDQLDRATELRRQIPRHQELAIADHDRQGIVELVGHSRDELADGGQLAGLQQLSLGVLQLAQARLELGVELAVLDGKRGRDGETGELLHVRGREPPVPTVQADRQGPDRLVADHERARDGRLSGLAGICGDDVRLTLAPPRVIIDHDRPRLAHRDRAGPALRSEHAPHLALRKLEAGPNHQLPAALVPKRNHRPVGVEELGRLARDEIEPLVEGERNQDLLDNLAERVHIAQSPAGLAIQARVVQCQHRLVGEGLQQRHLGLWKVPPRPVIQDQRADGLAPDRQRDGQDGIVAHLLDVTPRLVVERKMRVCEDIACPGGPARAHGLADDANLGWNDAPRLEEALYQALGGDDLEGAIGPPQAEPRGRHAKEREQAGHDALAQIRNGTARTAPSCESSFRLRMSSLSTTPGAALISADQTARPSATAWALMPTPGGRVWPGGSCSRADPLDASTTKESSGRRRRITAERAANSALTASTIRSATPAMSRLSVSARAMRASASASRRRRLASV